MRECECDAMLFGDRHDSSAKSCAMQVFNVVMFLRMDSLLDSAAVNLQIAYLICVSQKTGAVSCQVCSLALLVSCCCRPA